MPICQISHKWVVRIKWQTQLPKFPWAVKTQTGIWMQPSKCPHHKSDCENCWKCSEKKTQTNNGSTTRQLLSESLKTQAKKVPLRERIKWSILTVSGPHIRLALTAELMCSWRHTKALLVYHYEVQWLKIEHLLLYKIGPNFIGISISFIILISTLSSLRKIV